MQSNQIFMKHTSFFLLIVFLHSPLYSQNNKKISRIKVDGVSAVIGDYVILESDIDKTLVEMKSQGISTQGVTRCQLLGKLMEDKLYAHHAVQDSLELSVEEIYNSVDQIIDNFIQQLGSIEKVLELIFTSIDEQKMIDIIQGKEYLFRDDKT